MSEISISVRDSKALSCSHHPLILTYNRRHQYAASARNDSILNIQHITSTIHEKYECGDLRVATKLET